MNMRIVPNLNDIDECPNCESRGLIRTTNEFGRPFKQCPVCTEQIYENEYTLFEITLDKQLHYRILHLALDFL